MYFCEYFYFSGFFLNLQANIAIGNRILTVSFQVLRDKTPFMPDLTDPQIIEIRILKKIERLEKQFENT